MKVFFYGLFMDEGLLTSEGIEPSAVRTGFVDDYALRIGERATLVRHTGSRAYGVVMDIAASDVARLYADDSVADYQPEPLNVEFDDGTRIQATCYNLPGNNVSGANRDYAQALLDLATRLEFPGPYLDEIRHALT